MTSVCLYVHTAECPQSGYGCKSFETLNASIKPAVANMMAQIKSRHSLHPLITPSGLLSAAPTLLTPPSPVTTGLMDGHMT